MTTPGWESLYGEVVVLDPASLYVYVGRLVGEDGRYFVLEDADCHDLRDSTTTRELYVLDCRRHGVGANRRRIYVQKDQIVSLSRLDDVVE